MSANTDPGREGKSVTVLYHDGTTEEVFVRKVPRPEFPRYGVAATTGSDLDELQFYVPGRTEEFWGTLSEASLQLVLETGIALTFPDFARWFTRQTRNLNLVGGEMAPLALARQMVEANPSLLNPDAPSRQN